MELQSSSPTSATVTITPVSPALGYDKLEATACIKGTDTCAAAFCTLQAGDSACRATITLPTPGATYTATAVVVKGTATGLPSAAIEFPLPYP